MAQNWLNVPMMLEKIVDEKLFIFLKFSSDKCYILLFVFKYRTIISVFFILSKMIKVDLLHHCLDCTGTCEAVLIPGSTESLEPTHAHQQLCLADTQYLALPPPFCAIPAVLPTGPGTHYE